NQADQCNETLSLSINGVDSQTQTPTGQSTFTGVSYIGSGGSASLHWSSLNSTSCSAVTPSVPWGSTNNGWSGDQTSYMNFSGSDKTVGTGDRTFLGITSVTSYALRCSRVGGVTGTGQNTTTQAFTGPTRTVTAWPPPTVNFNGSTTNYRADQSYTIKWNSTNATSCTVSSSGNQPWNQTYSGLNPLGDSRSASFGGSSYWWDNSGKSYTVKCTDPAGRTSTGTYNINTSGSGGGGSGGGSGGGGRTNPPACSASAGIHDNGDGTAYPTWNGSCPEVSAASGYYYLYSSTDSAWNIGWVGASASATWLTIGPGYHCVGLRAGADPWGWQVDSGQTCKTIVVPPVHGDMFSVGDMVWYRYDSNGCSNDGLHDWYICNIGVTVDQPGTTPSQLHCTLYSDGSSVGTWTGGGGGKGQQFTAPTWSNSGFANRWQLGYYGSEYSTGGHTIAWTCRSDRGGTPYSNSIYRSPQYPPGCPYGGSWPYCNPKPSGGGGGGGGGSGGGGGGGSSTCPPGWRGTPPNCTPVIGCFTAGTMILTTEGQTPIEKIKAGDWVETWDTGLGKMVPGQVVQTFVHQPQQTLWLLTSGGSVTTTSIHPFWDGHSWVQASKLIPGKSYIYDSHGHPQKLLLAMKGTNQTVYNLEIGNSNHDFFANGFLVHNKPIAE
ncbi:MAG TPA: Hint domain-containing protein, partial [Candidatus Saccharimonadales bacterium]|nr:Hint domain-containing protein [Candidatus Saccharimonadales bacterium]